ncbi:MAG: hypothetical protein KF908_14910 [Nitrosomonas sp.]|nr:hypothetical protein [Nitrosomonas sp.]MCW5607783.1 hypothetical protein [Nitrosomonas sp.]
MPKDRSQLTEESLEAASFLLEESTERVAALFDYQCTSRKAYQTVMREHSILVATHALLAFLDRCYEERFPPEGEEANDE